MTDPRYCGFCMKSKDEVRRLIDGPVCGICDECVELMVEVLKQPPVADNRSFRAVLDELGVGIRKGEA